MKKYGGYLTSPDVGGIYEGMKAFEQGKVKVMNVDYEEYNRNSVRQFERLFSESGR
ncbi:MAG: hypothetical protein HFH61_00260 [Lachnospiraceae bacterium]|nr:hypothetical protein [Lachnospiraceae bacterium]